MAVQNYPTYTPTGPVIDTNPPDSAGAQDGQQEKSPISRAIGTVASVAGLYKGVQAIKGAFAAGELAAPNIVSATAVGEAAAPAAPNIVGATSVEAGSQATSAGIANSLGIGGAIAGTVLGTMAVIRGTRDLIQGKDPKSTSGRASRLQTAISSGGISEVARALDIFGDSDKWKTEGNRLLALKKQGVEIPDELLGPAYLTKGRSKEELIRGDLAPDFVGLDENGTWVNNRFATSRDENDLYAFDKWGAAAFFELFPDWLKMSEDERYTIAAAAKGNEHHGTFDINNKDELLQLRDQLKAGQVQAQQAQAAMKMLTSIGVSDEPGKGLASTGVDTAGRDVYADKALANNTNIYQGAPIPQAVAGISIASGVNKPEDLEVFQEYNNFVQTPENFTLLDDHHAKDDPEGFLSVLGPKEKVGQTGYALYEKWGTLSPAQKSIGVASAKLQGLTFRDGTDIYTKNTAEPVPGVPNLTVADVLKLSSAQINVVPLSRDWKNYSLTQDAVGGSMQSANDIAQSMFAMGMLGYGEDGVAVSPQMSGIGKIAYTPYPQYGIGAIGISNAVQVPPGYVSIGQSNGQNIVAPQDNADTSVMIAPAVTSEAALKVYKNWSKEGIKQDRGQEGGSAYVSGLNKLGVYNPEGVGAMMVYNTQGHSVDQKFGIDGLPLIVSMMGINMGRLLSGESTPDIDKKYDKYKTVGPITQGGFNDVAVAMRREYALNNIVSKEQAYQLANQAFAERRYSPIDLLTSHRISDMVFDPLGYTTARSFIRGKDKGMFIGVKRYATAVS